MTDRTLCKALSGALEALSPVERRIITVSALDDYGTVAWLRDLKIGLAAQLLAGTEHGQTLCPALIEALDDLDAVKRRNLSYLATTDEVEVPPWIRGLFYGVVLQIEADNAREKAAQDAVLTPLEADHCAEVEAAAAAATWPTEPEDRSKGVAWFPWAVPDTIEGLDTPCI
jgi:hypothetical protein